MNDCREPCEGFEPAIVALHSTLRLFCFVRAGVLADWLVCVMILPLTSIEAYHSRSNRLYSNQGLVVVLGEIPDWPGVTRDVTTPSVDVRYDPIECKHANVPCGSLEGRSPGTTIICAFPPNTRMFLTSSRKRHSATAFLRASILDSSTMRRVVVPRSFALRASSSTSKIMVDVPAKTGAGTATNPAASPKASPSTTARVIPSADPPVVPRTSTTAYSTPCVDADASPAAIPVACC